MTFAQAREAALLARRAGGIGEDGPIPDLVKLVERGGVLVFGLPFGRESIAGLYERQRDVAFIAVNSSDPPVRQRFTLAHEYGHHSLNHGARLDEAIDWGASEPRERDANEFSALLLMPEQAIANLLEALGSPTIDLEVLVRLAAAFGVSASAACVRLRRLGRLSPARAKPLEQAISQRQHLSLHQDLGLGRFYDTLQAHCGEVRLPAATEQRMLELVRSELLAVDVAAARLGITSELLLRRATEHDDGSHDLDA